MDEDGLLEEENSGGLHLYDLPHNPKYRILEKYKDCLDEHVKTNKTNEKK